MGRHSAKARSKTGSRERENFGSNGKRKNTAEFGANWKGVSDEAHDKALEEADWIEDFTDELKTVKTQDRNKKLSNAQTMHAGLDMQAMGGTFEPPRRRAEDEGAADDDEEEPGHPSNGYREPTARIREKKGQRQIGPDGERLPNAAIRGFGSLATNAAVLGWKAGVSGSKGGLD